FLLIQLVICKAESPIEEYTFRTGKQNYKLVSYIHNNCQFTRVSNNGYGTESIIMAMALISGNAIKTDLEVIRRLSYKIQMTINR
ncbi:MAG: hypothetical protein HOB38_00840, partial [Deltaproteobacteria bacterium]|nr:hypothetical protein [Deltaproteobacteria bacterium]